MEVKKGNKISVEYEGKLEDGTVFDSSKHGDHSHPLVFVAGVGQVVPGFDEAVMGMKEGEEKEFTLKPEEAYGDYREEMKQKIPRDKLPADPEPKEGMVLMMGTPDGHQFPAKIDKVDDKEVTVDLNHPLAGKSLTFKIQVVKIEEEAEEKKESLEEMTSGEEPKAEETPAEDKTGTVEEESKEEPKEE